VDENERLYPVDVCILGAYAVMQMANPLTHLVQQAN
jgi:hypothetical protein